MTQRSILSIVNNLIIHFHILKQLWTNRFQGNIQQNPNAFLDWQMRIDFEIHMIWDLLVEIHQWIVEWFINENS